MAWRMRRALVIVACLTAVSIWAGAAEGRFRRKPSPLHTEMAAIVTSEELSKEEKMERLRGYLSRDVPLTAVFYMMNQVDIEAARRIAVRMFGDEKTPREHRLQLGRLIMRFYDPPGFIDEYALFLVGAVLDEGEKEFMAEREQHVLTAVGEYAHIAAGFERHKVEHFDKVKDNRAIPILIKCLEAPDTVYGEPTGCVVLGKAGEPTGRNVARQNIPIALARLSAKQATKELENILRTHHDWYLRSSSAYALARLLDKDERKDIEAYLNRDRDARQFLFRFGTGLIEKGDDDGVKYMALRYSPTHRQTILGSVLYRVNERLRILRGFKSEKTKAFYVEVLTYKPMYYILTFDARRVRYCNGSIYIPAEKRERELAGAEEALALREEGIITAYRDIVDGVRLNGIREANRIIAKIARRTKNSRIKQISEKYLGEAQH